jgi:hypothetical protein
MANNRLQLRCVKCDSRQTIARYYPSEGWYADPDPARQATDTISIWLRAHTHEPANLMYGIGAQGEKPFELVAEIGANIAAQLKRRTW